MKVLFLTTSFPRFEGDYAGIFVFNLAKYLNKNGIEVEVVVPNEGLLEKYETIEGIHVHRFNYFIKKFQKITYGGGGVPENLKKNKLLYFLLPFFLVSFFLNSIRHSKDVDLIQCLWFPIGILGILINLFYKKKLVVNIRGSDRKYLKKFGFLSKIITKKSDALIAVGKELLKGIKITKVKKLFFIPNGVDLTSKEKFEIETSKKIILYAGNLSKNKSVDTIIEAAKIMKNEEDFMLLIVGGGPERKSLESKAQGLEEKVVFSNFISQKELFYLMEKSYVFVLPSLSEGRSNVILEAFASGLPVIASRIPANLEIVEEGANGLLFEPGKSTELAEKIFYLLKNINIRDKLGEGGREFIRKNELTWENTAKKYIKIYKSILKEEKA